MKYEEPNMEVILFDDLITTLNVGDSEGGVEEGFPGLSLENGWKI